MYLEKRYGGKTPIKLENNSLICNKKIGQRDTFFFICNKCGKEGHRRISLFKNLYNITDRELYCEQCNREQNSLDKYGVKNPMQRNNIVKILKQSNLEKYGVENPMQVLEIAKKSGENRRKISYDFRKQYETVEIITPFNEFIGTHKNYEYKCKVCGFIFSYNTQEPSRIPRCPQCISKNFSKPENNLMDFIENFGFKIIKNSRNIIPPYELDIFIPEKNIAIEHNGFYWHSEVKLNEANNNPRNYHLTKQKMCNDKGIFLIQIFEDEWSDITLKKITENRLKSILGIETNKKIFARNTDVKEILAKEKNKFLKENHLQGTDSALIKLGLFHDNELVSVMTFSNPRHFMGGNNNLKDVYELSRFVNKNDYVIIGGASKLLKYFINKYSPKKIYSYSDKRWSNGNLYKTIGFSYDNTSSPSYWYFKNRKKYYRYNFRKERIKTLFPEIYSKDKTEYQMMLEAGYDRIWDCGNDKWVLEL